jgi:predicted dehydrogenase
VRSHITVSRVAAQSGPRFRVLGSESAYTVYGLDGQEPLLKQHIWPGDPRYGVTPAEEWGAVGIDGSDDGVVATPTAHGDYPAFYAGVAAAILDGAPVPVSPWESLAAFRILEQAHGLSTGR